MRKILYLLSIIGLCSFTIEDPFLTLLKKLDEFTKKYPTEKVYLHLDKPYYAAGDDIWFKAYVTDWKTGEPTTLSAILYVELINQNNKVEKHLKLPMQSGLSWGDFKLADTLSEGNYRIRAYTQWMRNAGPNFFFDKTLKIGSSWANKVFTKTRFSIQKKDSIRAVISFTDPQDKPLAGKNVEFDVGTIKGRDKTSAEGEIGLNFPNKPGSIIVRIATESGKVQKIIPIKVSNAPIDIQFLPEGGTLIQGIKSKIAVKAIGPNGFGLKTKGKIVDQTGEEVSTFETSELGMGVFSLTPSANKTYTANIDGQSILIPKAASSGYAIAFSPIDSTKIKATVQLSADLLNKGDLYLVSQKNGTVYWDTKLATNAQSVEMTYEKKDFAQGIIQFTLFSPDRKPVCERVVFIRNITNDVDIDLQQLKPSYQKKEKVELLLSSSLNAEPVAGSFSVAITNADAVVPDLENESHILASLLLTSDLVGYVEKPNSYFLDNNAKTSEALDQLMLTQGWRKIDWKLTEPVINHKAEKSLSISGAITKSATPLPKSKVSLINNKDGLFLLETVSNDKGEFVFDDLEFIDSTKFIIQARTEAGKKDVQIKVNLYPEQEVTASLGSNDVEVNINQSIGNYLQKSTPYFEELTKQGRLSKTIMLKEVKIEGDRKSLAPNSQNLNGPGNADQIIDVKQLWMANSLASYLQGRILGAVVDPVFKWAISRRTFVVGTIPTEENKMRIILDGTDVGSNLDQILPHMVESIEIIQSTAKAAIYGPKGQGGLIIVTTKKGADKWETVKYAPGLTTYTPKGYYASRTFYSPKYDVEPSDKPDLRTTVHWMPNLVTDETGKIKFDYFNTDQAGNYRIVIEGIDINGNLARKTYTYKIN